MTISVLSEILRRIHDTCIIKDNLILKDWCRPFSAHATAGKSYMTFGLTANLNGTEEVLEETQRWL